MFHNHNFQETQFLHLFNNPVADGAPLTVETYADFHQPFVFCLVGQHIAFLVDLPRGFLCTLVHLLLNDVDSVRHIHHCIGTTYCTFHLRPDVDVEKTEHQVKDGLEMLLRTVFKVVGDSCHICAHILQRRFNVVAVHCLAETQEKSDFPIRRGRFRKTYFIPFLRKSTMYFVLSTYR